MELLKLLVLTLLVTLALHQHGLFGSTGNTWAATMLATRISLTLMAHSLILKAKMLSLFCCGQLVTQMTGMQMTDVLCLIQS